MKRYNPTEIEPKWQKIWDESGTYTANLASDKPKYIAMSMFNYPSGAGIHIGHAMNYTVSDVKARFKRQQGFESYHPIGWDAFGLPAENYAIKAGVSPQESMATIIPSYHKQYKAMGWSNDWEKEIATHLPEYYKWTQWIFRQMHEHGLAYQDSRMQWWCDKCQTVLANEQVIDGKCWRHDSADDPLVEKREVKQWFFKITEYADELLDAIDSLDWTESVKLAQKNWIGRSQGAQVDFAVEGSEERIAVFTTRPDTLFGATFLVLAPEHPLVATLTTAENEAAIADYLKATQAKSDIERQEADREKTGVFTGSYAVNPVNGEKVPVWVADYVLVGYGTGAIMAVPAHDERDNAFARKFKLPIREVIAAEYGAKAEDEVWVDGVSVVVYDKSTNKYLGLDWGKDFIGLVAGGLEGDEDYLACATRELAEEAGITDADLQPLGSKAFTHYYHGTKKINRFAATQPFLAIVDSQTLAQTHREAHETFTTRWYEADEILDRLKKFDGTGHWQKFMQDAKARVAAMTKGEAEPLTTDMVHEGIIINSGAYDGTSTAEMREKIVAELAAKGVGKEHVTYRMRDWSVSRQRYWGAPIPIIHCAKCGPVLVPEADLPVELPLLDDFKPSGDGRSALARAKDWLQVTCPQCDGPAERETDTLDTYICSSWYMYRYFDAHNQEAIFDSAVAKKWEPIDFYNGADHATAHLLYARFMARFFKKLGLINNPEPFKQFLFNGKVTAADGMMFSKSKGNGVDPLEIINQGYGADALRTYLMFASPLELWTRWNPQGVPGAYRFLNRLWSLVQEYDATESVEISAARQEAIARAIHPMIKKVTEDIEANRYNTAIAAAMACLNELYKLKTTEFGKSLIWQQALESMVACVAPFAPHIAEELWTILGHTTGVSHDSWPTYEQQYLVSQEVTIVVQVNGKVRANLQFAKDATQDQVATAALADEKVQGFVNGKEPVKTIFVPNKLISFVIK